jgi:DNA-binding NarL/FixJ family response regulator
MLSKLGALYLDTLDYGQISPTESSAQAHPEDITARQLIILGHIQSGLVNGLIAKVLMLSESTIRQETVKIYRSLGVGDRLEAVKKAKVLGLLPKRVALQG